MDPRDVLYHFPYDKCGRVTPLVAPEGVYRETFTIEMDGRLYMRCKGRVRWPGRELPVELNGRMTTVTLQGGKRMDVEVYGEELDKTGFWLCFQGESLES